MTVEKDDRYAGWFRRLRMGAPEAMLRQDMIKQGLNPDYLS